MQKKRKNRHTRFKKKLTFVGQKFKVENPKYTVFRLERVKTGGGGIVIGALDDLKPVLVNEGDDESEALTVQISVNNLEIRCVVGYEACESDRQAKKIRYKST